VKTSILSDRLFFLLCILVAVLVAVSFAQERERRDAAAQTAEHAKRSSEWFSRGRVTRGQRSAELRRRAYESRQRLRIQSRADVNSQAGPQVSLSSGSWVPLGPVPLTSDASGDGTQDYGWVAGRATSIAVDPADPTGNTVYIGGAQSGVWKSTNAVNPSPTAVTWSPITDNQATLSIGALAIQPGNNDVTKSLILAATGEANNSADSYFGLGILRSADAGNTWTLISTANGGSLSFAGLGGARVAFSTASGHTNTVVAAMATSEEGTLEGASSTAKPGLYTSLDAGQTWTYNTLSDTGSAIDPTSATAVVYNTVAGLFFAAVRYHGVYSSPDGLVWTRLANQPGGAVLASPACPQQSATNQAACPMYRADLTIVPGRNEMYVWYVSQAPDGSTVDRGIWQSLNAGSTWTSISDTGITNCGDIEGCGVQQGTYNLALQAVPNAADTDLYAGTVNLYRCTLRTSNPGCTALPFLNLTHAYGCSPVGVPAHVHPAQHAIASQIPTTGTDSGNALLYFANDGGIYRALDGYSGLTTGSCSGTNQFDNLNHNLGSMTQFLSFSQHPSDVNTIIGGTQGNGTAASIQATTNPGWSNILGGDGGTTAMDLGAPSNWFASNPDVPPGGLGVQLCTDGISCTNSNFEFVVTSRDLAGDDGAFNFPYILDPYSASAMLVGTCRVWRGPRAGGSFTALSPNFDTLGSGTCSGTEVNQVRALATAGLRDSNGSSIIYAGTNGLGPVDGPLQSVPGGRVWVTRSASDGVPAFLDVTENGPQGNINTNQYPISGIAIDSSDASGNAAYATVMGFTGGPGHVWKTTNSGATWTDFSGNLPDAPVNAVVVYPPMSQVYVGTDVGVFGSSTSSPSWTELGPSPSTNQAGFLPNVPVTALGAFASGGQQLLRASTYGRGIWQFNLVITPDFLVTVTAPTATLFSGQTTTITGSITAQNGYANSVTLSCAAGTTSPPTTCSPSPATLTPASKTPFTVTVGGSPGDYSFNLQVVGSDSTHITHTVPLTVHILGFGLTVPSPSNVTVGRGQSSSPVSFQVTAAGSFAQTVTVSCTTTISGANCNLTPSTSVNPTSSSPVNMTASVDVPAGTAAGTYSATIQATTMGAPATLSTSFNLNVIANPDFVLTEPSAFPIMNAGSSGTSGPISITGQDGFSGSVSLTCSTNGSGTCAIAPTTVNSFPATANVTVNAATLAAGNYSLTVTGASGSTVHALAVPFTVADYSISGAQGQSAFPGAQVTFILKLISSNSYSGKINVTCDASALAGTMCSPSPGNPVSVASGGQATLTINLNIPKDATSGSYNIKINTQDTTGNPSHSATIPLTVAPDFLLTSSTSTQTVNAGQTSGPYNLRIQPVGSSFDAPITLACAAGLPAQAQCSFSPQGAITPGGTAVDVVMSIATKAGAARSQARYVSSLYVVWALLPGLVISCGGARKRKGKCATALLAVLVLLALILPACGGISSGAGGTGINQGNPVTYHVTVTGTSAGTPADAGQSTVVTLVVN